MARPKRSPNLLFNNRVAALMVARGVNQSKLADVIGVSRQMMSYYMTGQSTPDINVLLAIAKYFNVSCDALLDEDNHDIVHELLESMK